MRAAAPALLSVLALACASAPPEPAGPLVVIVSIDTLRADRLGALGHPDGLTPNLDAFAADAVVFESAWSEANITSMSHASLFTSRYPSEVGDPGPTFRLQPGAPTLAEVLGHYGWATAAFTAGAHLEPGWGLERGFEVFKATEPLGSLWHTVPRALGWLDAQDRSQPTLLFVHGYDVHAPYLDPAPYGLAWAPAAGAAGVEATATLEGTELIFDGLRFFDSDMLGFVHTLARPRAWDAESRAAVAAEGARRADRTAALTSADLATIPRVYDGAVAYADVWFGVLMQELRARGRYDEALIVVLSDHGESLGEAGRFGHGDSLADAELHVPLLVRAPGAAPRRVAAPVELIDVMPTVLDAVGAVVPADARGRSLGPWLAGQEGPSRPVVFAEGNRRAVSARSAAGRLTFTGLGAGSPWLAPLLAASDPAGPAFALDSAGDPAGLRDALVAWRAGLSRPDGSTTTPVDPALVEQMRARGYWAPR